MNKKLYVFITLLFSYTYSAVAGYPYQEPGRFNQDYQKSNYYLAGDFFAYSDSVLAPYKHLITISPFINPNGDHTTEFSFNTPYNIFSMFYRKGQDEECEPYRLPKAMANNTVIIFDNKDPRKSSDTRSASIFPKIVVSRTNDIITIFVANPPIQDGTKLIFNIANFEQYMKTTAWYNSREQLGGKFKKDSAILFGFSINADNFNFSIPQNDTTKGIISFSLTFADIIGAMRFATCKGPYQFIRSTTPFTNTLKDKEKNIANSYDDLYKTHTIEWKGKQYILPPSITIQAMTANDFKQFAEIIKKGNSQ